MIETEGGERVAGSAVDVQSWLIDMITNEQAPFAALMPQGALVAHERRIDCGIRVHTGCIVSKSAKSRQELRTGICCIEAYDDTDWPRCAANGN